MIKIITVGSIKEAYLRDAIKEYITRIQRYTKIEIIEDESSVYDCSKDNSSVKNKENSNENNNEKILL